MTKTKETSLFHYSILGVALINAFRKLNPCQLIKQPVIFAVEVISIWITVLWILSLLGLSSEPSGFLGSIALCLWFTVLFGTFAESIAECKGKAYAGSLRLAKSEMQAKWLKNPKSNEYKMINATELKRDMVILASSGDLIPADGDVIEGIASIDESAVTGESAPVIRESGGDRCAVTAGTRVISDEIKIQVTSQPGEGFLDRMIALVEGASRKKTPNEIALTILLSGFTLVFIVIILSIEGFAQYVHTHLPFSLLMALFVTLIPTTIAGLLSSIGISGMNRLFQANVLAKSGRAVEAAGDIDILILDKTGTITVGNRFAKFFMPMPDVDMKDLVEASLLSSMSDETPEGRSIIELAVDQYDLDPSRYKDIQMETIPFSAQTRISGVNISGEKIRKGAVESIIHLVQQQGGQLPELLEKVAEDIAKEGGTPLAVSKDDKILGVIHLKDVIKDGMTERFEMLRRMGIKTIMVTGDNPLTAAAIAAEAGVDDFLEQATPEAKLELIRKQQAEGKMIAMCGDGTNDAPALAQSDVGVAMNTGTSAAKEAGNMIDLDSDPTKLIEIVTIGKQLLMTRGSLTTFSMMNDIAKYFAILPALFAKDYPILMSVNIMHLKTPESAVLSAVIFNALIIICLIPLALRGVHFRAISAASILQRNLWIYGLGGIIVPFIGIKLIDWIITGF